MDYTDTITVHVGDVEFIIHTAIAAASSSFLRKVCGHATAHGTESSADVDSNVTLMGDDDGPVTDGTEEVWLTHEWSADIFNTYVHWLYTGKLVGKTVPERSAHPSDEGAEELYFELTQLFEVGWEMQDGEFRNRIMDYMVFFAEQESKLIGVDSIKLAYLPWAYETKVRAFIVDSYASSVTSPRSKMSSLRSLFTISWSPW